MADIARAGKSFIGNVYSNIAKLVPEPGEVAEQIARKSLASSGFDEAGGFIEKGGKEIYEKAVKASGVGISFRNPKATEDQVAYAAKKYVDNNKNAAVELIKARKEKRSEDYINNLAKKYKNAASADNNGILANVVYGARAAKAYMNTPGKRAARWGTYATVAVGGRILSGGDLFHNNTGERDIAGIPFI